MGKLKQFKFRTGLAKQLIGGYSSCVSAAQSSNRRKIEAHLLQEGNAGKHLIDKIKGRKRQCVQCKRVGTKTPKGRPVETTFECVQCGVALCKEVLLRGLSHVVNYFSLAGFPSSPESFSAKCRYILKMPIYPERNSNNYM